MNNIPIIQWMIENDTKLYDIIVPLLKEKQEALDASDILFHDTIEEQFYNVCLSNIIDEITSCLGCSTEDVHNVIDDPKELVDSIIQLGEKNERTVEGID